MVIYFSGTGNSRYLAEMIAKITGDSIICANDYIKSGKKADFLSDTPYVFVCPIYAWQIPRVFERFIMDASFSGSDKAYFLPNFGASMGKAAFFIERLCTAKSMKCMGVYGIKMPENYIAMFKAPAPAEQEKLIAAAEKKIPKISQYIIQKKELPKSDSKASAGPIARSIAPFFYRFAVKDKAFKATDKCTGCGKCEKLCPMNNIKIKDGKPSYGGNCTHCMACICGCPFEAIEYGQKTVDKTRYYLKKSAL